MFKRRKQQESKFKIGGTKPKAKFFTFEGKTIWDAFQLLIIPLFVALIAVIFSQAENRRSESIEAERNRQNVLDSYFEDLNDLLLVKRLRESSEDNEARSIARAITLSTLRSLDSGRKAALLKFLYESRLIGYFEKNKFMPAIIILSEADLSYADLSYADLSYADLRGAYLRRATLSEAKLSGADLSYADLREADLSYADLRRVDLSYADLSYANLSYANLREASLSYAYLGGADLSYADLREADLKEADLREADLSRADLSGADLFRAVLDPYQLEIVSWLDGATLPNGDLFDSVKYPSHTKPTPTRISLPTQRSFARPTPTLISLPTQRGTP